MAQFLQIARQPFAFLHVGAGTRERFLLPFQRLERGQFGQTRQQQIPVGGGLSSETRLIGEIVNARPAVVGTGLMRASGLIPEWLLMRHLATIASRSALSLPD